MAELTRRQLLATLGLAWLADTSLPRVRPFEGRIVGADQRLGHLLRDGVKTGPAAGPIERADVVIVGSGVSGASAAWRLAAAGVESLMLELEGFAGGTSSWGEDGVVAHPWGAHYLPVPEPTARAPLRLLEELGVITGWDAAARPILQEQHLCHAPEERLFHEGAWHMGLVPQTLLDAGERAEFERFLGKMDEFTHARGNDGRPAFAIPLSFSSRDAEYLKLDRLTMAAWLDEHRFTTPFLRWYVEYATLDDFGADLDCISAWAALHYFCSRRFETEQTKGSHFLVWPEGNGHLVRHMLARAKGVRRHRQAVLAITPGARGVVLDVLDASEPERPVLRRIEARAAILAVAGFIAKRLLADAKEVTVRASSPWLVANLHVRRPCEPNRAWDSVLFDARGLGYVDAGHQRIAPAEETVLTYFRAYGAADVRAARAALGNRRWAELAADVLLDLAPAHPELGEQTSRLDCMLWGHAMPRPEVGFLSATREPMNAPVFLANNIAWAHVDQSGIALFEEANTHGVRAAEAVLDGLGHRRGESWI